ncbi:hypothetical protein AGMMS49959_16590 [Planctomycetales bacterium]|nr:hypothetical protein AGMMS49959_16590 [Planctomycetales bacterium]
MSYKVELFAEAKSQIAAHEKSGNLPLVRKLERLLEELREHPYTGTGKPERLSMNLSGYWSRRINREHRLVYAVNDQTVTVNVIAAAGHYEL